MFKKKKKSDKTIKSFDDWAKQAKQYLDDLEAEANEQSKDKKVYRKFSNNKEVSELFPRESKNKSKKNKKSSNNIDKKTHEGNESIRGSIRGSTMMGAQGDPVNPDLRRRLAEKKAKDRQNEREEAYTRKKEAYALKKSKANHNALKKKKELKKAILYAEILSPPLSKRKNR